MNDPPVATADTATTAEGTPMIIVVLDNDYDVEGNTLTVIAVGSPIHGTATPNEDNTVTYHPDADYNGGQALCAVVAWAFISPKGARVSQVELCLGCGHSCSGLLLGASFP